MQARDAPPWAGTAGQQKCFSGEEQLFRDSALHYRFQRFTLGELCWSHGFNAHQHLEWIRYISRSLFQSSFVGVKSEFTPRPFSNANLSTINRDAREIPLLSQTETLIHMHFWALQCRKEPLLFPFPIFPKLLHAGEGFSSDYYPVNFIQKLTVGLLGSQAVCNICKAMPERHCLHLQTGKTLSTKWNCKAFSRIFLRWLLFVSNRHCRTGYLDPPSERGTAARVTCASLGEVK